MRKLFYGSIVISALFYFVPTDFFSYARAARDAKVETTAATSYQPSHTATLPPRRRADSERRQRNRRNGEIKDQTSRNSAQAKEQEVATSDHNLMTEAR